MKAQNLHDVISIPKGEWLMSSPWTAPSIRETAPDFPKVLFIEEDVAFRKKMTRLARENGIHMVTGKSLRELSQVDTFDVAILDLDCEFAKKQVGRFLGKTTPVVILGESEKSAELGKDFPSTFKRVLSKNLGERTILEEALALVGARHFLEDSKPATVAENTPIRSLRLWNALWLLLFLAIIIFSYPSVTNMLSSPNKKDPPPPKQFRWDRAPIPESERAA